MFLYKVNTFEEARRTKNLSRIWCHVETFIIAQCRRFYGLVRAVMLTILNSEICSSTGECPGQAVSSRTLRVFSILDEDERLSFVLTKS